MRMSLVPLALFAAALAIEEQARALSCAPAPPVAFRPPPDSLAPVNAQVLLEVDERARAACSDLALVPAPTPGAGAPPAVSVACREQSIALARKITRIELTPLALLAPMTRYEVRAGGRVLATFKTSNVKDTTPPRWLGVAKARGNGATIAVEFADLATDDHDVVAEIRYAVWIQRGPGAIDYTSMPTLVAPPPESNAPPILTIGEIACDPQALSVASIVRVGVRAMGQAGNMSKPGEAIVIKK